MTKNNALLSLAVGNKIRLPEWEECLFLYVDDFGNIRKSSGDELANWNDYKDSSNWEIADKNFKNVVTESVHMYAEDISNKGTVSVFKRGNLLTTEALLLMKIPREKIFEDD